jgi:hypothetical protein
MKKPFYVVWGDYYNPVTDSYVEKMLGCYQDQIKAKRMVDALRDGKFSGVFYCVKEEYFCDEEDE